MEKPALMLVRSLVAALAMLPTPALMAQSAALSETGWVRSPSGPRVLDHWTEEWDPVARRWARVGEATGASQGAGWRTRPEPMRATPLARFGPFVVVSDDVATIIDSTDSASPAQFRQMLAAYPDLRTLRFVDAPGTHNDIANLELGRMIRSRGLETHIPTGGSARSGAVELFLAGSRHTMDAGALFAVHSWRDSRGREPKDFAQDDPANRIYIDYYVDMGMTEAEARAFYAMTNSVPHSRALWFGPDQMRPWIETMEAIGAQRLLQNVTIAYRFDQIVDARFAYGG